MKAHVRLCICAGKLARAFAARLHKVECWFRTNFRSIAALNHHKRLNNAFARPNIFFMNNSERVKIFFI